MKKIMLIAAIILLAACSKQPPLLFPKFGGAKGNIYSITEKSEDKTGYGMEETYFYNKDGLVVKLIIENSLIEYFYDDNNLLREIKEVFTDDEYLSNDTTVISLLEIRNNIYIYEHSVVSSNGYKRILPDDMTIIRKEGNHTVKEEKRKSYSGKLTYNRKGQVTEQISKGRYVNNKQERKYKNNEWVGTKSTSLDGDEPTTNLFKVEYTEKDERGNWIKAESYMDNETIPSFYITREITYLD